MKLDLLLNLDAIRAEERLRDHWHELSAEGVRQLTLLATGSEEEAEDAFVKKVEANLRAGGGGL